MSWLHLYRVSRWMVVLGYYNREGKKNSGFGRERTHVILQGNRPMRKDSHGVSVSSVNIVPRVLEMRYDQIRDHKKCPRESQRINLQGLGNDDCHSVK